MRRSVAAIVGSLSLHALLAAAIVLYAERASGPTVVAELDLSSVELSFSDEAAEDAQAVSSLPAAARQEASAPKPAEPPPELRLEKRLPPDPSAYKFPEPRASAPTAPPRPAPPRPAPTAPSARSAPPSRLAQARIDAPPRPKRTIRPEYPKGARQRGEQGEVVLEIAVGADGACAGAEVVVSSGFSELDAAAAKAVKAARFVPARAGGRPVVSTARLKLVFRLN